MTIGKGACVLLMCGGAQTRMNGTITYPKQLALVDGVPNAVRTVQLVRAQTSRALVQFVAPFTDQWQAVATANNALLVAPHCTLFLDAVFSALETVPATVVDRYVVLCGDVVWSPEALATLVRDEPLSSAPHSAVFLTRYTPNIFTGRDSGEIYGFAFPAAMLAAMKEGFQACLAAMQDMLKKPLSPEAIDNLRERNCRPWLYMHLLEDAGLARVVEVALDDYTDDIDTPDDLVHLSTLSNVAAAYAQETK